MPGSGITRLIPLYFLEDSIAFSIKAILFTCLYEVPVPDNDINMVVWWPAAYKWSKKKNINEKDKSTEK